MEREAESRPVLFPPEVRMLTDLPEKNTKEKHAPAGVLYAGGDGRENSRREEVEDWLVGGAGFEPATPGL